MESLSNAASTVKNTLFGQSTAADTDTSHRADSHAQRAADPTSATRDVTSDTFDGRTGSKFGTGSTAGTLKHETAPSTGFDTARDTGRGDSLHHSDPLRGTTSSHTTGFTDSSTKSILNTNPNAPTGVHGTNKHLSENAPVSDTASTDEIRHGHVYQDSTHKSIGDTSHHHHGNTAALGTTALGAGAAHHHNTHHDDPRSTNVGPHSTNIGNKLDPRVDSDRDGRGNYGTTGSTNTGPHSSNIGNKLDPWVDSDRDGRAAYGTGSTTAGPHSTNVGNKLDPRVDSDRDHRGTYGTTGSTNAGPHSTNVGNKLDPRVDSDRDNRGTYGTTGSTNAGPHSSNIANKLDPRVDSDRDGRATHDTRHDHHMGKTAGAAALGAGTSHHNRHNDASSSSSSVPSTVNELHSVNAPPGPIGAAVKVNDNQGGSGMPTAGVPGMPGPSGPSSSMASSGHASGAQTSGVTDTANAAPASTQHTMGGSGPGTAVEPSVSAMHKGTAPQKHQGADRPTESPDTGYNATTTGTGRAASHGRHHGAHDSTSPHPGIEHRRKSEPLVAAPGPDDTPGTPGGSTLPSSSHEDKGMGTKYERSTGLAAEGGDFDAARPGAGREADRLLDEHGVQHGKASGHRGDTHDTTHHGKASDRHDDTRNTTHQGTDRRGSADKPGIGEKIKEKLHLGGKH